MSALLNPGFAVPVVAAVISKPLVRKGRKRSISPQAGRALEMLGHAIDYLTDEFIHEGGSLCAQDPRLDAIQLLMARNREIYFACPVIPSFKERCLAFVQAIFSIVHRDRGRRVVHTGRAARWIFR